MRSGRKYVRWLYIWSYWSCSTYIVVKNNLNSVLFSSLTIHYCIFALVSLGPGKGSLCRHHPGTDRRVWRGALWWYVFSRPWTPALRAFPTGGSGWAGGIVLTLSTTAGKTGPGSGERGLHTQAAGAFPCLRGPGKQRGPASPLRHHQRHFPPQSHSAFRSHVLWRMHHGRDRVFGVRPVAAPATKTSRVPDHHGTL